MDSKQLRAILDYLRSDVGSNEKDGRCKQNESSLIST